MESENDKSFPVPENEKSWGAVTRWAIENKIIEDSKQPGMPHPRRHGVKATVWRSLIYRGGQ